MNRISSLREPIFAKQTNYANGWIDTYEYKGLGYRIEIDKSDDQIISATMYMFDKVISAVTTETNDKLSALTNDKLSAFKGLELYVWKNGETVEFGFLSGTNRNKTTEEIESLRKTPQTLEQAIDYIKLHDEGTYVSLILVDKLEQNEINVLKQEIEDNTNCNLVMMENEQESDDAKEE
jgi:hypothetical protein